MKIFTVLVLTLAFIGGLVYRNVTSRPEVVTYTVHDPQQEARILHDRAKQWLLGFQKENGLFHYQINPRTGAYATTNNELRQLMASRVLALEAENDPSFLPAHEKNMQFVFDTWYQEQDGKGYILYEGKSKLGSNAMLLRSLVASPHFTEYKEKARATAEGILFLMNENGSFRAWLDEPDYEYDEDYLLTFYSGEALLALMEYYEKVGDERTLARATKAGDFYINRYVTEMEKYYYPAYVPWMTLALEKLYEKTNDIKYTDAIFAMNDKLLELQDTTLYKGRFYNPKTPQYGSPHSSSDAVFTEGLIHAWDLAKKGGDREREEKYFNAIVLALGNLATLQYREPVEAFPADPKTYIGAIRFNADSWGTRIDCAQHLIDGLSHYLSISSN